MDIRLDRKPVNIEALDDDLRAALGTVVIGASLTADMVIVHLTDTATPEQIGQARAMVNAHDSAKLSARQQRQQQLEQARQLNTAPLNPADYSANPAQIQRLAQKIAWLEREIADLRGA